MPLSIGKVVDDATNKILNAPLARGIARNPIYTALLISVVVVIIILIAFRNAETEEPLANITLRVGFWTGIFVLVVMLLHNKILMGPSQSAAAPLTFASPSTYPAAGSVWSGGGQPQPYSAQTGGLQWAPSGLPPAGPLRNGAGETSFWHTQTPAVGPVYGGAATARSKLPLEEALRQPF